MRSVFGEKEEQAPFCSFGEQTKRKIRCFETTRSVCSFLDAKIEYRERKIHPALSCERRLKIVVCRGTNLRLPCLKGAVERMRD